MIKKINLLYVVSSLRKCGPTNQLFQIIKFLDKSLFNITVLTLFNEENESDFNRFMNSNVNVVSLNLTKTKNYIKIIKKIKKYCNDKEIDIVHSSGLAADFSCCFLFKGIHVSTIRNYAYFDYISQYGKIYGRIMIFLNKWAIEHTDYPICCSKSIKVAYEKKINKNLHYIQNGVDIEKYKYKPEFKMSDRIKLDLPEDKLIFIVSGSLNERKDPLFIIDCFKDMNLNDKAILLFIGDGDLYKECKKYESDQILLRGTVNNVTRYLNASDIYISASKSEGLPNSVLEAASCGLQLILSEIPQHKEIFENNKNLARFFRLNNKAEFINCINEILDSGYVNNIESALYVQRNFSSKRNSEKYSDVYKSIVSIK